jgi:hypothetical protein
MCKVEVEAHRIISNNNYVRINDLENKKKVIFSHAESFLCLLYYVILANASRFRRYQKHKDSRAFDRESEKARRLGRTPSMNSVGFHSSYLLL